MAITKSNLRPPQTSPDRKPPDAADTQRPPQQPAPARKPSEGAGAALARDGFEPASSVEQVTGPAAISDPFPPGGRHSSHGFIVFGGRDGAFFLSHIPMFMNPHDVQVLFEVVSADLKEDLTAGEQRFSLQIPDPFSLDDMVAGRLTKLTGTLFRGNHESGGTPLQGISVEVRRTLKPTVLAADNKPSAHPTFTLLGSRERAFLVHQLSGPPDFDQILAARLGADVPYSDAQLATGVTVAAPGLTNEVAKRVKAGPQTFVDPATGKPVSVTVERELLALLGPDFFKPADAPASEHNPHSGHGHGEH